MVLIMLKKEKEKKWDVLTEKEKTAQEEKSKWVKPNFSLQAQAVRGSYKINVQSRFVWDLCWMMNASRSICCRILGNRLFA